MECILTAKVFIKKRVFSTFINSINTHEIHKCPRGEIGRHKGLKKHRVE